VASNSTLPPAGAQGTALNLRPLPLGELLDRAFTLYFRNVIPFSALLGVVLVPSIITSYFQTKDILGFYIATIQHQIAAPNSTPDLSKLTSLVPSDALVALQFLLAIFAVPIAYAAVVVGVSRAYVGLPITFVDCYRQALRRWLAIIILIIIWIILAIVGVFVLAFGMGLIVAVGAAAGAALNSKVMGVFAALVILASMIGLMCIGIMLYLTSAISFVGVVLEKTDPVRAVGAAFSRIFGGRQFWRGFVLALALTGIYLGAFAVLGGGGMVTAFLLKAPALYVVGLGLMQLFFVPFAVVAAAVYYYDLRIRREGYDLQMLADQLVQTGQTVAPTA
jgi:hypothetical protein